MLLFLSYARPDKGYAEHLRDLLTDAGFEVWLDIDSIGQEQWEAARDDALARCDALVVVLSDDSVASQEVTAEWQTALRNNKAVIPVRWRVCDIPEELKAIQICDFSDDGSDVDFRLEAHHFAKLIRYLRDVGPAGVYINYREGAKDEALSAQLRADLRAVGIRLWSDLDDVTEQVQWGKAAQRGLDRARLMLVIASQSSMYSRRVDTQTRYFATELGKRVVVLLLDERARMGSDLIGKPWIDFTFDLTNQDNQEKYREAWVKLLAELKRQGIYPKIPDTELAADIERASQEDAPILTREKFGREYDGPLALFKPPVFQSYTRYTRAELMIDRAKSVLWVSGISLIRLSELTKHFERLAKLADGDVKFLLIDPESEAAVLDAGRYVGRIVSTDAGEESREYEAFQRKMRSALDSLMNLPRQYPEQTEIRVSKFRPAMGYFIADPDDSDGFMTAYPYLYHIDTRPAEERSPFLHLARRAEERWFGVFRADFEAQWNEASEWP